MSTTSDSTDSVHGGPPSDRAGTPVSPPLLRTTTFRLDDEAYRLRRAGQVQGTRIYAREANPTVERVEGHLAHLEGAEGALLFSSGMAAFHCILMATLERGQNVVAMRQLYGGSSGLMGQLLPRLGVELRLVDVFDHAGLRAALDQNTRLLCCESISNPLTRVANLPRMAQDLGELSPAGLLVVDGTLAGPAAQRPLEFGADLVWHSASKSLAGHSDVIAGAACGDLELLKQVWSWRSMAGGCLDPEAAWLLERGMRTLALRVRAASDNALSVARFLEQHPAVERVEYCGLSAHPDHGLSEQLLTHTGGLLSFVVRAGDDAALELMRRLKWIVEAASLGGVESLISRPMDMSQSGLSPEQRERAGIVPGLLRLALGIEETSDLVADLSQALTDL